ncbi:MAG: TIGR03013 family XrtA/PEP-CTERM system glycosyltransferase [Pseudomonadota bacterium]
MVRFSKQSVILFTGESLLIVAGFMIANIIRFLGVDYLSIHFEDLFTRTLVITGTCQLTFHYGDLYDLDSIDSPVNLALRLLQSLGAVCIILAVIYLFVPGLMLSRDVFFIGMGLAAVFVYAWRYSCHSVFSAKKWAQRVVILGSGSVAEDVARIILDKKDSSVELVGFVDKDPNEVGRTILAPKIIGTNDQLCDIAEMYMPVTVVVALDDRRGGVPFQELLACKMRGIAVEDHLTFLEKLCGKLMVENLNPSHLIFSDGFKKPRLLMTIRRLVDVFFSFAGLIILSPLMFVVSIVVKLDSRGPVFFRQERVGENNGIFKIYKFRSMRNDAENCTGPVWAEENDPRITRVGRFIRRCRIDEIPQFWNVLKGDMSFIGPRPERPCFVKELTRKIPYYAQRHSIKPGITGWAQIKYKYGATEGDALEKLKYEIYYIKNLSPFLDLLILFETVKIVLFGKGAR